MRIPILSLYLLLQSAIVFANKTVNIDSLEALLPNMTDVEKLDALTILSKELSKTDFKKSTGYSQDLLSLSERDANDVYTAKAYSNIADAYYYIYNFNEALSYYQKSYKTATEIENDELMGNALNNIGILYYLWGDFANAAQYFAKSKEIYQRIHDYEGEANCLNNLGNIYLSQGDIANASKCYDETLAIKKKTGNKEDLAHCLNNIGTTYENTGEHETALKYYQEALLIAKEINNFQVAAKVCQNIGLIYHNTDNKQLSLNYLDSALILYNKTENTIGISEILNNIGLLYYDIGDFTKSLEYYRRALKLQEKLNNKSGIGVTYFNIGNIYEENNDYKKAEEYFLLSLKIKQELNDAQSIANIYNSLGIIYSNTDKLERAIDYFYKAIAINEEIDNNEGIALNLENLGTLMEESGKPHDAIQLYERSLKIEQNLKNSKGIAKSLLNLGRVYKDLNEYQQALSYLKRCEAITKSANFRKLLMQTYKQMSEIHNLMYINDKNVTSLETAHDYYIEYSKLKDTIYNEEKSKQLSEIQTKIETIKKDKELELLKRDQKIAKTEKAKQTLFIYFLIFGIILFIVLLLLSYNRYLVKNKANALLEKQNKEIREQKDLIEIQRRDILDSISSASRIQQALLPQKDDISSILHDDCFIFYKPRDIVSGDFYWLHQQGNKTLVATADCTGHGVPGAFMSMLGISLLNELVTIKKIHRPNEILNFMRDRIIKALHQTEENDVKEGMDMSLISIDHQNKTLEFCGAYNSLLIARDNEIIEIKADKMPVAIHYIMQPFNTSEVAIKTGDMLYLASDGYPDQMGGERNKKFMKKRYKDLLLSIHKQTVEEQEKIISQTFEAWRGNYEQVDDIIVMGIKIK